MRDGLPQNSVTDILQAQDGYIWLTTYGGIVRFDGLDFVSFHSGNTDGLGARFTSVAQSPDGTLWFGSEDRGLFRHRDGSIDQIGPTMPIWDVASDEQGRVWVATSGPLYQIVSDQLEPVAGIAGARSIADLGEGVVIASGSNGRAWCVVGDCEGITTPFNSAVGVSLWFRAPSGAIRFSLGADIWEQTPQGWERIYDGPEQSVFPLTCTLFRGKQLCAQDDLPFYLDKPRWAESRLAPTRVMLVDQSGGVWVGTDGGGLLYYQRREVSRHLELGVFSVVEAPGGDIWYTTSRATSSLGDSLPPWGADPVNAWNVGPGQVAALHSDEIWLASEEGAVAHPLPSSVTLPPAAGSCFVEGDSLYGLSGLAAPEVVVSAEALGGSSLVPLRCEGDDAMVMVDSERLVRLSGRQVVEEVSLGVGTLVRDALVRGEWLWAASYGGGLLAIRNGAVQARLTPDEGMCDYAVSRLFDLGDDLWINTNHGVGKLSWAALEQAAAEQAPLQCQRFESGEGNGNGGVLARDGVLWVPTIQGVVEIHPDQLSNPQKPQLYIDAIHYAGQSIADGDVLFGPGALDVRFVGLYFTDPHSVVYRYRFSESEPWSSATDVNQLHYAAMGLGSYRFEVQARGRDGLWSEPVSFSFSRMPMWYELGLVRVGLPLLALLLVLVWLVQSILHNRRLADEIEQRRQIEATLATKQAEIEQARRAREAGQRLEALGRLAGGVAHDFNNLMTVLSMHAAMLDDSPDPEARREAEGMLEVLDRATTLTRQLLVFGRAASEPRIIELGEAVEGMMPVLERLIRADIAMTLSRDGRCGVRIDPGRLEQIVTNLVLNARDAIPSQGTIALSVRAEEEHAVLEVSDDGVGMSAEVIEHIFEPYFSTRSLGDGTGLGMATVHGAIQEADGEIAIDSAPGQGTTVRVRLPRCALPARSEPTPSLPPEPVSGLRVLIVDDRPEVLRAVAALGVRIGWTVVTAGGLREAAEAASRVALDLLLTDVVMPGGDGPAVQRAVRQQHPDLPTVFMTGYTTDEVSLGDAAIVLNKPFTVEALREATRIALGRKPGSAAPGP